MKRTYILIYDPENLNSILGVFTSGKKLADAAAKVSPELYSELMVKIVEPDVLRNNEAGHDYQGTRIDEFLACPISRDDTGGMMVLNLKRVLGYEGSKPITGSTVVSFKGNEKKCTKDAKQWLKDNPQPIQPVFEWKKEEKWKRPRKRP